jgi:hypothetical protein
MRSTDIGVQRGREIDVAVTAIATPRLYLAPNKDPVGIQLPQYVHGESAFANSGHKNNKT